MFNISSLERNRLIVEASDRVVAIWDGQSRGTMYTIKYAARIGKEVEVIIIKGGKSVKKTGFEVVKEMEKGALKAKEGKKETKGAAKAGEGDGGIDTGTKVGRGKAAGAAGKGGKA